MKVPKLSRSLVTHYAALAKSEQVAIEIKVEGASFRITPFDAAAEARNSSRSEGIEQPRTDGLKSW
jgi:hypothetical protein